MGWMYAVTNDGGANWKVWDATTDLPDWQCCNHNLISEVDLTVGGEGVMTLNPIEGRKGEVSKLRTIDYGHTWKPFDH